MSRQKIVLAFSGGLDTSFCVPYLQEQGYDVVTCFVDTGGVSADERAYIEDRAKKLGAVEHVTADGGQQVWDTVVVPMVRGGRLYGGVYPLLVSDRYVIVEKSCALADKVGTKLVAHGCTGMGNDQVRFDQTVRSLGDYEIKAPIREIQKQHSQVRVYEAEYLKARGFDVREKTGKYSINHNLLGMTASGREIDEWQAPDDETYAITAHPTKWPKAPLRVKITFENGVAVAVDGVPVAGPKLLADLNERFGAYGVGRSIYTGDTTIGLKGRIVFECPGLTALMVAHRALEESVLSGHRRQVGGARLQGLLLRAPQARPRGLPRREPDGRERHRHPRDLGRPVPAGRRRLAPHPQEEGRRLRAVRRLGRRRGRGLHPALRHVVDPLGAHQPEVGADGDAAEVS
jgi:argininosuccinate synthase